MSDLRLIRHGQATPFEADTDRLSPLGETQARAVGAAFQAEGWVPTHVLHGPLVRQRRSAQLAAGQASGWPGATQDDRLGYRLREQLEDALAWDRASAPLYRLDIRVEQSRRSLGRRIDDTATRYELTDGDRMVAWAAVGVVDGVEVSRVASRDADRARAGRPGRGIHHLGRGGEDLGRGPRLPAPRQPRA